ncbi:MAG: hypothetical protein M1821_003091 [Bathelium mastoideum]|nr:MAG: hypothetical protein M1821_003091 [Bathelium mastoideum]
MDKPALPPDTDTGPNHAFQVIDSGFIMFFVGFTAVCLRFLSRRLLGNAYLLDDWLIVLALLFSSVGCFANVYSALHNKFGQHVYTATIPELTAFLKALFVYEIAYPLSIAFSKWSILGFYWRIFHVHSLKIPLILTSSLTGAWLVVSVAVTIFGCNPVEAFWDVQLQAEGAKCIISTSYSVAQGSANIGIDIILLVLPLALIRRLRISAPKKAGVACMFLLGGLTTICSALRLWRLVLTSKADIVSDVTWQSVGPAIFSVVETNLSILCACLPSMTPFIRLVTKGSLKSGSHSSHTDCNPSPMTAARNWASLGSGPNSRRNTVHTLNNFWSIASFKGHITNTENYKEEIQLPIIRRSFTVSTTVTRTESQTDLEKLPASRGSDTIEDANARSLCGPKHENETSVMTC